MEMEKNKKIRKRLTMKTLIKILCLSCFVFSQDIDWMNIFGNPDNDQESKEIQETIDGGYIIIGYTDSEEWNSRVILLVKLDSNGIEEWSKTFNYPSQGYSIKQASDGGYIILGHMTSQQGTGQHIWLIKTDSNGNTCDYSTDESCYENSSKWVKKFERNHHLAYSRGYSISETIDGGYIISGMTTGGQEGYSSGLWLIKTDENGETCEYSNDEANCYDDDNKWVKIFLHSDDISMNYGYSVHQTIDEGYIVTGTTDYYASNNTDVLLIKTDISGNEEWRENFGGDYADYGKSVQQTVDGGYVIVGKTPTLNGGDDIWLIKTDTNGNIEWDKKFGSNYTDYGESVQQTVDGGFIITGSAWFGCGTGSSIWVIKTDNYGDTCDYYNNDGDCYYDDNKWTKVIKECDSSFGLWVGHSIFQNTNQDYIATGFGHLNQYGYYSTHIVTAKISVDESDLSNIDNSLVSEYALHIPYPNPFNPTTTIPFSLPKYSFVSIKVYDINGALVSTLVEDYFNQGTHSLTWDGTNLSSGQYFLKMESGSFSKTQIISLIK